MKRNLAKHWYDLSSQDLPREVGAIRPSGFDSLPFGMFRIDRQGLIHDWVPEQQLGDHAGHQRERIVGHSIFAGIAPCFFIRPFREQLFEMFLNDDFDETFYFTIRFPGDWRQAALRVFSEGNATGLVDLTISSIRSIRPAQSERLTA